MKTGDIELTPDEFKDGWVRLSVYDQAQAELARLRDREMLLQGAGQLLQQENQSLRAALEKARISIREFQGMLRAHEIAIHHDFGVTNWTVTMNKIIQSLHSIDQALGKEGGG